MNSATKPSIDDLLKTLKAKLAEPGTSLLPVLSTMSRFAHYSLHNQLLIFLQRPTASRVMGFQSWRQAGYQVRKGKKGIAIYAPMHFKVDDPDTDEPTSRLRFRIAHVFDIAQVDPIPGTTAAAVPAPAPAVPLTCLEKLKAFLVGHNIEVDYANLGQGCYGYTDGKRITCAMYLASHVEFGTLIHETAHALLHFGADRPNLTIRETEAEAIAYLISEQLGLEDTQMSIDYIRSYRGTPDTLDASLQRIRATAARLAREFDAVIFDTGGP
jgi:antirestriction protein ArdC